MLHARDEETELLDRVHHFVPARRFESEEFQGPVTHRVKSRDRPLEHRVEHLNRPGDPQACDLRALKREALWGEFTNHDVKAGNQRERHPDRDSVSGRRRKRPDEDASGAQAVREGRFADPPEGERREGDPELGRRDLRVQVRDDRFRGGGTRAPLRDELIET